MSFQSSVTKASASSKSISKVSSHMSNKVNRQIAKLAVDAYRRLSTAGGNNIIYNGKKYPKLAGDLGDEDFKRYSTDPPILSLQTIYYCQRGLESVADMASRSVASIAKELKDLTSEEVTTDEAQEIQKIQNRGIINHEYLVLKFQSNPTDTLYILAEKAIGEQGAGIAVQKVEPTENDLNPVLLLEIDCGGVAMNLDSLQKILLEADTPHYDLRDHNCWDYATNATKRVLMECIAMVSGGDEAKKAQLEKAHKDLEANLLLRGITNAWKSLVECWAAIPGQVAAKVVGTW